MTELGWKTHTFSQAQPSSVILTFVEPCNRFEQWKAEHAPRWFRRLFPVRHTMEIELSSLDFKMDIDHGRPKIGIQAEFGEALPHD